MRIASWVRHQALSAAAIVLLSATQSPAGFQTDVAVSADGKQIVTSMTDGRVLYFLDGATLSVTRRVWNEAVVKRLCLNEDGSVLAVTDDARRLRLLRVATGEVLATVKEVGQISFAPSANLMAAVTADGPQPNAVVRLLSMSDASEKAKIELPAGFAVSLFALSPDGTRLVLFSRPLEGSEVPVPSSEWPKEFKDSTARQEYALKHDGKHCEILTLEAPTGRVLSKTQVWYTAANQDAYAFFSGQDVLIMQYNNPCALVSSKGEVSLFPSGVFCNYGLGWSRDGGVYLAGSLAEGVYVRAGTEPVVFKIQEGEKLPGWPEYFYGFGVSADGTAFGVTSAGRIAKISAEAKIVRIVPFF